MHKWHKYAITNIPIQIDHSFTEFLEIVNTKQESEKDSVDNKNGS
ncbi:MAG TPA: hypothetical protein VK882_09480 [Nitrososphaeraceae archaeon]|nr:hypothetical protein [Nitrososphaeraceae archaeon]